MKFSIQGLFDGHERIWYLAICLFGVWLLSQCTHCPECVNEEYLFFYSPYCSHCYEMMFELEDYPQFEWISILEPENKGLLEKFNVSHVPTFVIQGEKYVGKVNLSRFWLVKG